MTNHEIHEPKDFNEDLRKLQTSDPAHADTFNPLFERLINNDVFLKNLTERLIREHTHSGADGDGSKIPLDNIDVPTGLGGILTAKELAEHVNERNPHGTRAVDVGAASAQEFTTHKAEKATLTKEGHVKLNDTTNSTSKEEAATANAVKKAFDRAVRVDSSQVNRLGLNAFNEDSLLSEYQLGYSVFYGTPSNWSVFSSGYAVIETIRTAAPSHGIQRLTIYHAVFNVGKTFIRSVASKNVGQAWGDWRDEVTGGGGDFSGIVKFHPNTSYTVPQGRNIILSDEEPDGIFGNHGDIWMVYE